MPDIHPARFFDPAPILISDTGVAMGGAKLYFYETGTTTPKDTYTSPTGGTANANPVVADSAGRIPAIFLGEGPYKVVCANSAGTTIWTRDPVYPGLATSADNTVTTLDASTDYVVIDATVSGVRQQVKMSLTNFLTYVAPGTIGRGGLNGLTLSNNSGDANNDIDIAAGSARDGTNAVTMTLASSITKRLDAAWSVGTNQGGLDTGTKANSTLYAVWSIGRTDRTVDDVLFSTSTSSPTMPTGYTYKRRIGYILTNGSGNIRAFFQVGDTFVLKDQILDVDDSTLGTTRKLYTLNAPPEVMATFNTIVYLAAGGSVVNIQNPSETDAAPSLTAAPLGCIINGTATEYNSGRIQVFVDSSRQIAARSDSASTLLRMGLVSWTDTRGRYD